MVTLVLTLAGSLMAQVNAVVLDRAVDAINELIQTPGGFQWKSAVTILTVINTVNNFFIEILPLFTSAVLALVLMFAANVYVGLVALCIIISHNIGQIIDADQIYVLENGHVVQQGTPSEVYQQGGLYKEIFEASARSMNVDKIASAIFLGDKEAK